MARTSCSESLIEKIEASEVARERARIILLTLTGQWQVKHAMERLGISRSRFQALRRQMLEGLLGALEPGQRGRPRKAEPQHAAQVTALQGELRGLRHALRVTETELALAQGKARDAVHAHLLDAAGRGR